MKSTNPIVQNAIGTHERPVANLAVWDKLLELYTDRAIQAEKLGKVHEAARYKKQAHDLIKTMRRADRGKCKMWNVRVNADGDGKVDEDCVDVEWQRNGWTGDDFRKSAIANPVVANAVSSHRTPDERIDAEIMASGQCANKSDARQWLVARRDDLMQRYGRDAYLDALERWNKNPDIQ